MSMPYIGEIRMFAGTFAPAGWAFCDGSQVPIYENDALFILIGTIYGGDGQETFALPNLQGRVPIHQGNGHILGEAAGVESVTLTTQQIPVHNHAPLADANGAGKKKGSPGNGVWANNGQTMYESNPVGPLTPMRNTMVQISGGSQPHDNMQPYLVVSFIISMYGIFPQQS